ncbi:MAG: methyltransferase [Holophagaceae bacterium]|nr:methyltransferase [Holophagaceae bacterium]
MSGFREAVLSLVALIPRGRVATYGQIALMAGFPRRARQVGMVLRCLPTGTELPWQRVVKTPGQVAAWGQGLGALMQIDRLRAEGVEVSDSGELDLERFRWNGEVTA